MVSEAAPDLTHLFIINLFLKLLFESHHCNVSFLPPAVWKLRGQPPSVRPWRQRGHGFTPSWGTRRERRRCLGGGFKEHDLKEDQGQVPPETFCRWSRSQQQVCFYKYNRTFPFKCRVRILSAVIRNSEILKHVV